MLGYSFIGLLLPVATYLSKSMASFLQSMLMPASQTLLIVSIEYFDKSHTLVEIVNSFSL